MHHKVNIPTAISDREARFLREVARDKSVIEFGALLGFSTVILAEVAGDLTSIDRHNGYTGPTLNQLISNLYRYGANGKVRVVTLKYDLQEVRTAEKGEKWQIRVNRVSKLSRRKS
jgi:predicted O-methyltransferase YrrM